MDTFQRLHLRGLHVLEHGGPLYMSEAERAEVEAHPYIDFEKLNFDIVIDDKKAAEQADVVSEPASEDLSAAEAYAAAQTEASEPEVEPKGA